MEEKDLIEFKDGYYDMDGNKAKWFIKHWNIKPTLLFERKVFKNSERKIFTIFSISLTYELKGKLEFSKYGIDIKILGCILGLNLWLSYACKPAPTTKG